LLFPCSLETATRKNLGPITIGAASHLVAVSSGRRLAVQSARRERQGVGNNVDLGCDTELASWVKDITGPGECEYCLDEEGLPSPRGLVYLGYINSVSSVLDLGVEPQDRVDALRRKTWANNQTVVTLGAGQSLRRPHINSRQLGSSRLVGRDGNDNRSGIVTSDKFPAPHGSLKHYKINNKNPN
jgi:hypothetical protein